MYKAHITDCCRNCAFWDENPHRGMISVDEELVMGDCHRKPPSTDGHLSFYPTTKSSDWCGEHKYAKEY